MQGFKPSLSSGSADLLNRLRAEALARGFAHFGVAPATEADGFPRFEQWLDDGYAGEMNYLHKYREQRRHPKSVVGVVKSVVMLGMDYSSVRFPASFFPSGRCKPAEAANSIRLSGLTTADRTEQAKIAKYAQGPDYHRYIWDRLNELSAWLMREVPGCYSHGAADSAPLLERDFARRAGLGWFGKNTMLIDKRKGSFFFLAALLTDLEFPASQPHSASHCGTCTACLDACPTQAFPAAGTLDATKCISYLTIELRGAIPLPLREKVGDWLFGCDVCQEVCPWNRDGNEVAFPHDSDLVSLDPLDLLMIGEKEFERRFAGTSLERTRRRGLRRNAAIVLGNIGTVAALPELNRAAEDRDEVVAEAARWAIERITARGL